VANIDRRRIWQGTTGSIGVIDTLQTQFVELIHVTDVASGHLEEALETVLSDIPRTKTVAGRSSELTNISGRMTSCDKALVRAVYGNRAIPRNNGSDPGIEFDISYESIQWVRTPIKKIPDDALSGFKGKKPDANAQDNWQQKANELASPGTWEGGHEWFSGYPNGDFHVNANGQISTYAWTFPVVRIKAQVQIRTRDVINVINRATVARINDSHTTLIGAGVAFWPYTLRFDGGKIKQLGSQSYGVFQFTAKDGPWLREYLISAPNKPLTTTNGEPDTYDDPASDDPADVLQKTAKGVAVGRALAYEPTSFERAFLGVRLIQ
jgi:hypothetical protein